MTTLPARLWRALPFVGASNAYFVLHEKVVAPALFFASPAQLWLGPLISRANKAGVIEEDWLPQLPRTTEKLRLLFGPLAKDGGAFMPFILQFEVGGMLFIGAFLEIASGISSLGAPFILRSFLRDPGNLNLALLLVGATVLATICGRAKDEVCRVHSAWIACMTRSVIFDKSLHLSPSARLSHSPAQIININSGDVGFIANYVVKIHDIWSAPLQIIAIAILTFKIMGWSASMGFAVVFLVLAIPSRLGSWIAKSITGYIKYNDKRVGALRDFLNNIKSVKAGAMEDIFYRDITTPRTEQLKSLRSYLRLSFSFFMSVNQSTPYLAACAAFVAYSMSGATLTPEVVFPCLAYFQMLYQPVFLASLAISRQFSGKPTFKRIRDLLNANESMSLEGNSDILDASTSALTFQSSAFEWPSTDESEALVMNIGDLEIPKGKLTTIIGPNGAGKSSLLQAIIGEMVQTSGTCHVNGSLAYCSQEPWIISGSLQDNIVFNSSRGYDATRYGNAIRACRLDRDFDKLAGGIQHATVGEAGSNLSGGQRARVALARALYSEANILLLDDPLSALDAHVRGDIFKAIRQFGKTIVLVTLHSSYVLESDHVIVLENNSVKWAGSKSDFLWQSWNSEYISHRKDEVESQADTADPAASQSSSQVTSNTSAEETGIENLWQEEERARGAVQWGVAKFYMHASGGPSHAAAVLIVISLLIASKVVSQYWFVWWIGDSFKLTQEQYMLSFLGLTLSQSLITAIGGLVLVSCSMRAARQVHKVIVENLMAAPLSFFQQNPTGRILNRLSRDVGAMDTDLMNAVDGLLVAGTTLFASVSIVTSSGVYLIAAVIPFLVVVGWCLQRYRVTAREIQRVDSVLQSPALSIVTESLRAPASVRAYGAVSFLVTKYGHALDRTTASKICRSSLDTWITFRAELASSCVLLALALLTVYGVIPHVRASLALGTATTLARNIYLLAWAVTDLEIQLNSVERLQAYHDHIPKEDKEQIRAPPDTESYYDEAWPESHNIVIKDAYLKYRTRPTAALDDVSLSIDQGQKIGLIGRTGSGKSTFISVISRLVDIQSGSISIGGVDTVNISPRRLRRTVVTLPQETLILETTIRKNIDPRCEHSDEEIWAALEACQMQNALKSKHGEHALDQEVSSDGGDFSAGQRQLICAARVLLEKPRLLLVDEASANVDFSSDEALQHAWRSLPSETTMVAIAHRASSLSWMDRIIVMDNGRVVEDGSPLALLEPALADGETMETSHYKSSIEQDGAEALLKALESARHWENVKRNARAPLTRTPSFAFP